MASQDELKKMMQERRKQKVQQNEVPKNARLVNGQLMCLECSQVCETMADFQRHLIKQTHKTAQQVLKRNAQIDASQLENEAHRESPAKKQQRLTKEQIERIDKEVDQEFAEIEQVTHAKEQENQLPSDFFDQIEIETKIQQQLQEEHLKKLKEEELQKNNDEVDVANEKNVISQLRSKLGDRRKQRQQQLEFDFEPHDGGFELNWKSKQ